MSRGGAPGYRTGRWSRLLRRILEVNPLLCLRCGAEMKTASVITQPKVVDAILRSVSRGACRDPFAERAPPVPTIAARLEFPGRRTRPTGRLGAGISWAVASGVVRNHLPVHRLFRAGPERAGDGAHAGRRWAAVFIAASVTFNRKNVNASIDESLARFKPVLALVRASGVSVRGCVYTAFVCPCEGPVAPEAAARVVARLLELGVDEVSIGDTIGAAVPTSVDALRVALDGHAHFDRLACTCTTCAVPRWPTCWRR